MAWFRSLFSKKGVATRARGHRREHRKPPIPSNSRVTRDVVGPLGWVWSNAWEQLDQHGEAYKNSFDRRLPPSLFVSERDRLRANQPMPLSERCIEDYKAPGSDTGSAEPTAS